MPPRGERAEGYPRRHRFTTRGSFAPVLRGGRKIRGQLAILHIVASAGGVSRFGVALTRKLVSSAVHRNHVKRGLRELFRRHRAKGMGVDCVVMLRERVDARSIPDVVQEVAVLLDRIEPQA